MKTAYDILGTRNDYTLDELWDKMLTTSSRTDYAKAFTSTHSFGISVNVACMDIKKVIFNNPATIVIWENGSKTVVKCGKNDIYDPEKGLAMCIAKRALGNKGNYYNTFSKHLPKDYIAGEVLE